jgi:uncharacterized membrane protein YtjA (UPF0391 family)
MLTWSLIFLIIALISAVLGYTGIAKTAAGFAKLIFYWATALFFISIGIKFIK